MSAPHPSAPPLASPSEVEQPPPRYSEVVGEGEAVLQQSTQTGVRPAWRVPALLAGLAAAISVLLGTQQKYQYEVFQRTEAISKNIDMSDILRLCMNQCCAACLPSSGPGWSCSRFVPLYLPWVLYRAVKVWLAEVNTRELQEVRQELAGVTADLATARQRDTNLSSHLARLKLKVDGLQLAFETGDGKFLISEASVAAQLSRS